MQTNVEMPRYVCHKHVWALQIKEVVRLSDEHVGLIFERGDVYAPIKVFKEWAAKHNPQPGGYFVTYKDGYTSYSPKEAFEEGYTPE